MINESFIKEAAKKSKVTIIIVIALVVLMNGYSIYTFMGKPYYSVGEDYIYNSKEMYPELGSIRSIAWLSGVDGEVFNEDFAKIYFRVKSYTKKNRKVELELKKDSVDWVVTKYRIVK